MTGAEIKDSYDVVGLMSGTSFDGLDIAHCTIRNEDGKWRFRINAAKTVQYSREWKQKLGNLYESAAAEYFRIHTEYGRFLGEQVSEFLSGYNLKADFIASHGHTVFHRPAERFTVQAGDGAALAAASGLPVVCDFRTLDIALGGQGAPLVPIGDHLLFGEYDFCLNIGGFANISFVDESGLRRAFDVCPANFILNRTAAILGHRYDRDGLLARQGKTERNLLNELNSLPYYKSPFPKSLGREFVEGSFDKITDRYHLPPADILRTFTEHIAMQIAAAAVKRKSVTARMMVTGGGARNIFLMERIKELVSAEIVIPEDNIIDYKEALVFAFLAVLRWNGQINTLSSVTGASCDSIGGAIYMPA